MNFLEHSGRLQLHNKRTLDKKIDAMLTNRLRSIEDRNRFLSFELNTQRVKFHRERFFVKGFEKTRTEFRVHANRGAYHPVDERLVIAFWFSGFQIHFSSNGRFP